MEDDGSDLVPRREVDRRHGADALTVEDDVFRGNAWKEMGNGQERQHLETEGFKEREKVDKQKDV